MTTTNRSADPHASNCASRKTDPYEKPYACDCGAVGVSMEGQSMGDPHPCDMTRAGQHPLAGALLASNERVSDDRIRLVLGEMSDYRSSQPWRGELIACLKELQERRAAETSGELEQLRNIAKAARVFVDAPAGAKTEMAFAALDQALYDGRDAVKTERNEADSPLSSDVGVPMDKRTDQP